MNWWCVLVYQKPFLAAALTVSPFLSIALLAWLGWLADRFNAWLLTGVQTYVIYLTLVDKREVR